MTDLHLNLVVSVAVPVHSVCLRVTIKAQLKELMFLQTKEQLIAYAELAINVKNHFVRKTTTHKRPCMTHG